MENNSTETILEMRNISKSFPGVKALDNVSFECKRGRISCLCGENGAGKSTLVKILVGIYRQDQGEIIFRGEKTEISSPWDAYRSGISMIYQESNLVPHLSVGENILLGHEPSRGMVINSDRLYADAERLLQRLGLSIDPRTLVYKLGVAQQQMVALAKVLSLNSDLVIMDEPTSSLPFHEVETLFGCVKALREQGKAIIYISHRLEEVFQIGDEIVVLRDGRKTGVLTREEADPRTLIRMMVGREVDRVYPVKQETAVRRNPILSVKDLNTATVKDINFEVRRGEVLGIGGLVGSWRTELARAIFGIEPLQSGEIYLDGRRIDPKDPGEAIRAGIGFLTENRKEEGLVVTLSVAKNISLPVLRKISHFAFWLDKHREKEMTTTLARELAIRTPSLNTEVNSLSGGNQQKVVLAKWLSAAPKLMIFDEPTRGLDVGAKSEIHQLIRKLAANGTGILLISSELPELIGLSDRVLVMRKGRMVGELSAGQITEDRVLSLAAGEDE
ncbi:MAG: sugar ABC transporter ATP-binding protein [Deltaproteobacteria bacterium]|nr:sugar ABC transporter ATP-binding protein [Deltaproteobacteria bacterium]